MVDTNRAPDEVIVVATEYTAFGWMDRLRILCGCGLSQRLPVALWVGEERQIAARAPPESGITVKRFRDRSSPALVAANQV